MRSPAGAGESDRVSDPVGGASRGQWQSFQGHPPYYQHVVVPESQDTIVVCYQPFVAKRIVRTIRVLSPVYFNNKRHSRK